MVMTDPIADYLTRIRNANMAKHSSVEIPASSMKKSLSEILKNEGFIRDYQAWFKKLRKCRKLTKSS